jgi:hypothetical protein
LSKELFDFINCLILYADGFNKLKNYDIGCGLKYKNQNDIEKIISDKVSDLQRIMTNLLEYVFLVRNFKDLDTKKIERAIGNARLYDQFDYTILLLRNRSRLIYFLLKTCNKISVADRYIELSNLLEQMPSKDMLTEAALINHLIEPYKKTL